MSSDATKTSITRRSFLLASAVGASALALPMGMAGPLWAAPKQENLSLPFTIAEAGKRLRQGSLTCEALTKACYACIKKLNPQLNVFITVIEEQALARAVELDKELRAGKNRGPLHGIPIVHKDLYDTKGIPTTEGSDFFRSRVPTEDATVVTRLSNAGAIFLGKTNMNELAAGVSGANKYFGDTHNPWNVDRSPGGSSSGTGVAVATGMCFGGTGSDTGGSIRVPCSFLGIVGIRPTYGRVSLKGVFPRAYSLDCSGPMTRTVEDLAVMLQAMAGYDPKDPHSLKVPVPNYSAGLKKGVKGLRIGIINDYTFKNVNQDVGDAVTQALATFEKLGAKVKKVDIPLFGGPLQVEALFAILNYEFNKVLGQQYMAEPRRKELFGPIVQDSLEKGQLVTDEVYQKALSERPGQVAQVRTVFKDVDVLLTPVMTATAPLLSSGGMDYSRQFTLPFSYTGFPSITAPCGFGADGMPIGMQIVANDLKEDLLIQIAAAYETASGFTNKRPPISCASQPV